MSGSNFPEWNIDFATAVRRLREQGQGESAQATILRIVWLRQDHAGVVIDSDATKIDADLVVMRAVVTLPDGSSASGFAAELAERHESLADALEIAETRAIGRALDVLGLVLPPDERSKPEPIRQTTPPPAENEDPPPVVDALRRAARTQPRSIRPVEESTEPAPAPAAPDVRFTVPTPFPQRSTKDEESGEEVALEDVSWTAFWRWAREKGLMRKADVELRIGRSIDELNPAEIRAALHETGIDLS